MDLLHSSSSQDSSEVLLRFPEDYRTSDPLLKKGYLRAIQTLQHVQAGIDIDDSELSSTDTIPSVSPRSMSYSEQRSILRKSDRPGVLAAEPEIVAIPSKAAYQRTLPVTCTSRVCEIHSLPLSHWNGHIEKLVCWKCDHRGSLENVFVSALTDLRVEVSDSIPRRLESLNKSLVELRDISERIRLRSSSLQKAIEADVAVWLQRVKDAEHTGSMEVEARSRKLHTVKSELSGVIKSISDAETFTSPDEMERFLRNRRQLVEKLKEPSDPCLIGFTGSARVFRDLDQIERSWNDLMSGQNPDVGYVDPDIAPIDTPEVTSPVAYRGINLNLMARFNQQMKERGISLSTLFASTITDIHEFLVSINAFAQAEIDELLIFFELRK